MNKSLCLSCALAGLAAAVVAHADPVTLRFTADRDTASEGDPIHWTVWVELPEDAPGGASLLGIVGEFRASAEGASEVVETTPLLFKETTASEPTPEGVAVEIVRRDRTPPGGERLPVYTFVSELGSDTDAPALWFDFEGVLVVSSPSGYHYYGRGESAIPGSEPIRVVTDRVNMPGCGQADLAPPFRRLDHADILTFIQHFHAGTPIADLVAPFGLLDFADFSRFIQLHSVGCYQTAD